MLADRVAHITPSVTLSIASKARAMQAEGLDVCSFSAGEPDFDTPEHIKAAAIQALQEGKTKYGPAAGIPSLREAIAEKLNRENGLSFHSHQIMISNGGKQTLFNLAQVLLQPGDEAIIPAPYWVSYPEIVKLTGAKPVIVPTDPRQGFKLTPAQLRSFITPATRLLVLNSPANPTGAVYTREELLALVDVIRQHSFYVVSDEIYEKLVYDQAAHFSLGALDPGLQDRVVVSSGFAKAYAMTGWRLGYLAGPEEVIRGAITLQSHSTSNVCSFAQYGALAALTHPHSPTCVEQMRQAFAQRRQAMVSGLMSLPGIEYFKPMGAFYVFFQIPDIGLNSIQFCRRLLDEHLVAGIPGVAFGADRFVRFSYTSDLATIEKGLTRLETFLKSL